MSRSDKLRLKKAEKSEFDKNRELRRKWGVLLRWAPTRDPIKTFLIVTEWTNTEPSYFEKFKLPTLELEIVWTGDNTLGVVNEAIRLRNIKRDEWTEYDEIWCVFDADPKRWNPKQLAYFNQAIQLSRKEWIMVAYSNQSFEYWILLHFNDHQWWEMERTQYVECINKELTAIRKDLKYQMKWNGSKSITNDIFIELSKRVEVAIKRAKKIYESFREKNKDCKNPWSEESSTTVFLLVEKLLKSWK